MAQPSKPQGKGEGGGEFIAPAQLALTLDPGIFSRGFAAMGNMLETSGGVEGYVEALKAKVVEFQAVLTPDHVQVLTLVDLKPLVERMFTVRRRLWPVLQEWGEVQLRENIADLLYGYGPVAERMKRFESGIPVEGKAKRALRDLAAELLHYNNPEVYPLMTRWVWDQGTESGALREFIAGGDHLQEVPFGESPEVFEGGRAWIRERLAELGVYRDLPFLTDMMLAFQYSEYLRAMAEGFLRSDFGGQSDPAEQIRKLLGIDSPRRQGASRVKTETLH